MIWFVFRHLFTTGPKETVRANAVNAENQLNPTMASQDCIVVGVK